MEKLKEDAEDRDTIDAFHRVLRGPRPSVVLVVEPRPTLSAPAATTTVVPPVSTPLVPQTSSEVFANALISTPSTYTGATSEKTSLAAPGYRA